MTLTPRTIASTATLALLVGLSGCATTQKADGEKIVVDGEKYIVLPPEVGSHVRRRVKVSDLNKSGIAPIEKINVTADTDTSHLIPTTSEAMNAPTGR